MGADRWIDVGARASLWGGVDGENTCHAAGTSDGARRDYIFIHPALLRYVAEVKVHQDATFATHSRVEVVFNFHGNRHVTRTANKICSLHDHGITHDEDHKARRNKSLLPLKKECMCMKPGPPSTLRNKMWMP